MTIQSLESHPKKYVSPWELAEYFEVPRRTIYHWIDKGALDAKKVCGLIRIPVKSALALEEKPARKFA